MRALFVEDHAEVRELLALLMEDEGLQIVACADAESALAAYEAEPVELLLTDVSLPGLSGLELARRLRERDPGLGVIFTTGLPPGEEMRALGGRTRALLKPFEPDELLAAIEALGPR